MLTIKYGMLATFFLLSQTHAYLVLTLLYLALAFFQSLPSFYYAFKPSAPQKRTVEKEFIFNAECHLKVDYKSHFFLKSIFIYYRILDVTLVFCLLFKGYVSGLLVIDKYEINIVCFGLKNQRSQAKAGKMWQDK